MTIRPRGLFFIAAVNVVVYTAASVLIPPHVLIALLNGLFFGVVVAVAVVFFPLVQRAMVERPLDAVSRLAIGIACAWTALFLSRLINTVSNISTNADVDAWLPSSPLAALAAYTAIVAGVMHILAGGYRDQKLTYNKTVLILALVLGASVAGFIFVTQRT